MIVHYFQGQADQMSTSCCVTDLRLQKCAWSVSNAALVNCRNWTSIHERKHVVIHLPSLGFSEGQRQGLSKPQVRENSQMARLCDLADPLVEVLYVAPFAVPEVCTPHCCTPPLSAPPTTVPPTTVSHHCLHPPYCTPHYCTPPLSAPPLHPTTAPHHCSALHILDPTTALLCC